ncbi:MAG TPA: N-acetylglucosamine kinase [Hanamia sp.]|nr:N-acetylglucosamine kinase [Hanamia sp.]
MVLIADSGSSKTNWCLIKPNGEKIYFNTEGFNPYFVDSAYIVKSLIQNLPAGISNSEITEVYYYGAGCFPGKDFVLSDALAEVFGKGKCFIELDLLAAARALLGTKKGFAAILGTGMNTCIYDGEKIIQNIDSLGYILGDEGSGAAMGKKLLGDYIRGYMPEEITQLFYNTFHLGKEDIFDHVYGQPFANRFCADFSKFIFEHIHLKYFYDLARSSFNDLFRNLIIRYPAYQSYSFNCVGSIGFKFKDILSEVALEFDMPMGKIIKAPIDGLVDYHLAQMLK